MCTAVELHNSEEVINDFRISFNFLYDNYKMNMTLKTHVIFDHYGDYFQWTKKTFRHTSGEFVEATHATFKKEERLHGFKVIRKIGTPDHREKALKSLIWHNCRRAGHIKAGKFKLRSKKSE